VHVPFGEAVGAVDRVDDPAPIAATGGAALLPEDRIPRPLAREHAAQLVFDGLVHLRDDAAVAFDSLLERAAKTRERDRARGVREAQREVEIGVGVEGAGHTRE